MTTDAQRDMLLKRLIYTPHSYFILFGSLDKGADINEPAYFLQFKCFYGFHIISMIILVFIVT